MFLCKEMGICTGVDLDALIAAAETAERIAGRPPPGSVEQGGRIRLLQGVEVLYLTGAISGPPSVSPRADGR